MNFDILETFALSEQLSDFKLNLPNELNSLQIPTHKIILVANSIFFQNLFQKEQDIDSYNIPLPQSSVKGPVNEQIFKAVLKFGYQQQTLDKLIETGLTEQNSFKYFSVAKQLDFKTAQVLISQYIEQRNFSEDNYLESLFESIKFDQQNWVFSLIQKISQNFDRYIQNLDHREELLKLPLESFKALLSRDDLYVKDEDCVYKLVIDYIKFREELEEKKENNNDVNKQQEEQEEQEVEQEQKNKDNNEQENAEQNEDQQEQKEENQEEVNKEQQSLELLKNYKLNLQEKKELLNLVRLSFVTHHVLMESVREKILDDFKDLILEAISAKLSQHEDSNTDYSIILKPRNSYDKKFKPQKKQVQQKQQNLQQEKVKIDSENELEFTPKKSDALESMKEYETIQSNFLDNSMKKERMKKIEFIYSYDLDENGALYWLGSKGRTKPYKNPYQIGQVKVFFSSISENSLYDYFVGRKIETCRTSNQQDSYMGVDFGEKRLLLPKQYTIRNRDSLKYVCLNWVLEGSLDYKKWHELDKRINLSDNQELNQQRKRERNALLQKGALTTWGIDLKKIKQIAETLSGDIRSFKGFRYFRIKQVGKNSSDQYNLVLSGFEIYGTGYGEWFFDKVQLI